MQCWLSATTHDERICIVRSRQTVAQLERGGWLKRDWLAHASDPHLRVLRDIHQRELECVCDHDVHICDGQLHLGRGMRFASKALTLMALLVIAAASLAGFDAPVGICDLLPKLPGCNM